MNDLRSMTLPELEGFITRSGYPPYRAGQVFAWAHGRRAESMEAMTDLPKELRSLLRESFRLSPFTLAEKHISKTDKACKYLFALEENTIIETVLMEHRHGSSLCVSTQAGCRMGCVFCASAAGGLERNLTAGEMCVQVYAVLGEAKLEKTGSLVLMGCGEPLDNFDNTLRFISLISHPKGLGYSLRSITVSTCGLVPRIRELASMKLPVTLAVSLHAPDDTLRRRLMPIARKYSIAETLQACAYYAEATRRRVTYEYALIRGLNDSDKQARELAGLLKGHLCHVNLLPVNNAAPEYQPSPRAKDFARVLSRQGVTVTVRRSLGGDVQAACGQLRNNKNRLVPNHQKR
jgi:23S rRNA (adenine2503-C2)-methyltransferase